MKPSPSEAAALFKLDLLADEDLACLPGAPNPSINGPAFLAALREPGVEQPDQAAAVKTALKLYLRRIVDGEVAPYEGVRAINFELTLAFYPHEDSPLCFFPRQEGEAHRHGVLWGLERLYDCYRVLRDSGNAMPGTEDLPKAEAVENLTEQLVQEAGKALDRLTALD